MTFTRVNMLLGGLSLGSWVGTMALAWQAQWSTSLGVPLFTLGAVPVYGPWAGWVWAWQWAGAMPTPFLRAGLLVAGVTGLCCMRMARPQGPPPVLAQWARRRDLRAAGLLTPHGIVLGRWRGRVLRHDGPTHTLVVAPTRSGKTTALAIPTLLEWRESMLIFDPKCELFAQTAGWRGTFSKIVRLDPTSPTSQQYNPLDAIRLGSESEIRDVSLLVDILADPDGDPAYGGAAQHFRELTSDLHIGVVLHGLYTQQATTLRALDDFYMSEASLGDVFKDMRATMHTREGCHPAVKRAVHIVGRLADRELSGVLSTASRALRLYLDPLVARMTARSDFALADLRERVKPMSLYLTVPYSDQERLRPLSRLIVRQVLGYVTQHLGGWKHRLLGLIDEVQALNRMPPLSAALNYAAGYGVNLCLITPSLHELDRLYGPNHNFLEGCHVRVVFAPNDPQISETFSKMTGATEMEKTRETVAQDVQRVLGQRTTRSTEMRAEPLLSATALSLLDPNTLLLLVGNSPPVLLEKARFFQDRTWQRRSEVEVSCHTSKT